LEHHRAACIKYETGVNNVEELKQRLIEVWREPQQTVDTAELLQTGLGA